MLDAVNILKCDFDVRPFYHYSDNEKTIIIIIVVVVVVVVVNGSFQLG